MFQLGAVRRHNSVERVLDDAMEATERQGESETIAIVPDSIRTRPWRAVLAR